MKCSSPLHLILTSTKISRRALRTTDRLVQERAFLLRGQKEELWMRNERPGFWTISRNPLRRDLSWLQQSQSSIGRPPFKMIWTLNYRANSSVDLTRLTRNWRIWLILRMSCLRLLETAAKDEAIATVAALDHPIEETASWTTNGPPAMQASWTSRTTGKTNQGTQLLKNKSNWGALNLCIRTSWPACKWSWVTSRECTSSFRMFLMNSSGRTSNKEWGAALRRITMRGPNPPLLRKTPTC